LGETGDSRFSNSVVEYYENRALVQAVYSAWKPFKITAGAGWVIGRTYNYFRADKRFDTGGAPILKVGVTAEF
jgi:hypothetical protein